MLVGGAPVAPAEYPQDAGVKGGVSGGLTALVDEQAGIVGGHAEKLPRDAPRLAAFGCFFLLRAAFAVFDRFFAPFGRGREGLRVHELEGGGGRWRLLGGGRVGRQGPAAPTDDFGAGARLSRPVPDGRDGRPLPSVDAALEQMPARLRVAGEPGGGGEFVAEFAFAPRGRAPGVIGAENLPCLRLAEGEAVHEGDGHGEGGAVSALPGHGGGHAGDVTRGAVGEWSGFIHRYQHPPTRLVTL